VYKPCYQEYKVPVRWTTYRTEHDKHECQVPVTTCKTVIEPRERVVKTCTYEPV